MPGYPAQAYVHPNGRVYEGTYTNPLGDPLRSRVLEYTADGTLTRSWTVPGQTLSAEHGIQVTTSDSRGRLVLLDRTPARALKLDRNTGAFSTYATFPDLRPCPPLQTGPNCSPTLQDLPPVPNFGAWGPDGSLYVTDYLQGVLWRVPPGGGAPQIWLSDRRLDGGQFGTTGIALAGDRRTLLVAQGSSAGLGAVNPATGKLYAVPIGTDGRPGAMRQLWESRPADLPDGFGIARSGRIYVPLAGAANQIAVLAPDGREIERFPTVPLTGDNGSGIPFDTPSSVRFLGTRIIVPNQSFVTGTRDNQNLLDVEAGEPGLVELIPGLDRTRPVVSGVSVFQPVRPGGGGRRPGAFTGGVAQRGGAVRVRFTLSEAARVTIDAERLTGGRWLPALSVSRSAPRGRTTVLLPVGTRPGTLHAGRHRITVRARDEAGNRSAPVVRGLRVVG